jgi:short-subunit dehydrogenase
VCISFILIERWQFYGVIVKCGFGKFFENVGECLMLIPDEVKGIEDILGIILILVPVAFQKMRNIIVFGASRGLGSSIVDGIGEKGDTIFVVSRTAPASTEVEPGFQKIWIQADLSRPEAANEVIKIMGARPIDVIIYNAGIWETHQFEELPEDEIADIVHVNLISPILLCQKLLPNIRQGSTKKIIFIGSTCGLENEGNDAIVYTATKFGIRGLAHSLRELLRKDGISVKCISPGSVASDVPLAAGTPYALAKHDSRRIPVEDIVSIINMILKTSNATCIKEIHVPALRDLDV